MGVKARWTLALAGVLSLALGATVSAAQTELTVAVHWTGDQLNLLKQDINEYEQLHPDIHINLLSVNTGADINKYLEKVQTLHAGGSPADILHIYSLWGVQLQDSGMLDKPPVALSRAIGQNFIAPSVAGATIAGQVWGYPTEIDDYALVYNKAHFADAGLSVPTTWDELVKDAVRLTKRSGDSVSRWGFAYLAGWDSAVVHPYLALLYGEGGRMFNDDDTATTLNSEAALSALQKELRLFKEGGTSVSASIWSFPNGNPSMTIMAPWWKLSLQTTMHDNFKDVGVADIPPGPAGKATVNYTWFWAVDSASQHKREAWAFLEWLNAKREATGTSRSGDILTAQGIIPSARYDIANHPELHDSFMQPFVDAMAYSHTEPNVYRGAEIKTILMNQIVKAWSLKLDPKSALTQAAQKIDPILQAHYK